MNTTDTTVKLPDTGVHTEIAVQYGMRFPDGTVKWTTDGDFSKPTYFSNLHRGDTSQVERWNAKLRGMASQAKIDVDEYAAQHQLIKRTVVVAVTEAEAI